MRTLLTSRTPSPGKPRRQRLRAGAAAALFAAFFACVSATAQCGTQLLPGEEYPGITGCVETSIWWDSDGPGPLPERLVIGGNFSVIFDQVALGVALWDPTSDTWSPLDNGFQTSIHALAVTPNNELIAAGLLRPVGGTWFQGVARWTGTTWQHLTAAGASNLVRALLVLPNGHLIAGGYFTSIGGVAAERIARWDGTSWSPIGPGMPGIGTELLALALLPGGEIVAAGRFESTPSPTAYLRSWDGVSWQSLGAGLDGRVATLEVLANGDLVAGGWFQQAGGTGAPGIARWDGAAWFPYGGGIPGEVRDVVELGSGDLLAGGKFLTSQGAPSQHVARWDAATSSWSALGNGVALEAEVVAELPNGDLFTTGDSRFVAGELWSAARFDGSAWSNLARHPGSNLSVNAITPDATGGLVVGGYITNIGGTSARHVARFDGSTWSSVGAGPSGPANAVVTLPDGSIVAAGADSPQVMRWAGAAWTALGSGMDDEVTDLAVLANGDLVAVGPFFVVDGVWSPFVSRWDGSTWNALPGGPSWHCFCAAAMPNGDLVVGGNFPQPAGVLHNIARWDGAAWSPLGAGTNGDVTTLLALPNGDLIAGGHFSIAGGGAAAYVARWDGASWSPLGGGVGGPVRDLAALPNGDIVAAGDFITAGGLPALRLARWDGASWSAILDSYGAPFGGTTCCTGFMQAVAVDLEGRLAFGGQFTVVNDRVSMGFARLESTCAATVGAIATTCVGAAGPVTLTPDNLPWVGSTFTSMANGFTPNGLGVALLGLTSPNVPLTWVWPNTLPGCDQLASQEAILWTLPQNGTVGYSFAIPNDAVFAGLTLFHQFLHFEVDQNNNLANLSSSNGLTLTIGAF